MINSSSIDFEALMKVALAQAELAASRSEVPIGAIVFDSGGEIISSAHNLTESLQDPTAHAEILAIRAASEIKKNWRLDGYGVCVTVEPCTLCFGAIAQSRIGTVVFGCREDKTGSLGSLYDLSLHQSSAVRVVAGVREEECRDLIQKFFRARRAVVY